MLGLFIVIVLAGLFLLSRRNRNDDRRTAKLIAAIKGEPDPDKQRFLYDPVGWLVRNRKERLEREQRDAPRSRLEGQLKHLDTGATVARAGDEPGGSEQARQPGVKRAGVHARALRGIAIMLVAAIAVGFAVPTMVEQYRKQQAEQTAEARLRSLKTTDPKQYLAELKAANDPRWESEFKALDKPGYDAYLADLKAKQEQERQAWIRHWNEQLASTKPDDLEEQYRIYSALAELDPSNKDYASKKSGIEPALLKAQHAKWVADDQGRNPQDYVFVVDFSWEKGGFGSVMLASFTLKNELPWPVKDITVACTLTAPSGTLVSTSLATVYERIDAKQSKHLTEVNMGFIHSQSSRASCQVTRVTSLPTVYPVETGSVSLASSKDGSAERLAALPAPVPKSAKTKPIGSPLDKQANAPTLPAPLASPLAGRWRYTRTCARSVDGELEINLPDGDKFTGRFESFTIGSAKGRIVNGQIQDNRISFTNVYDGLLPLEEKYTGVLVTSSNPPHMEGSYSGPPGSPCKFTAAKM